MIVWYALHKLNSSRINYYVQKVLSIKTLAKLILVYTREISRTFLLNNLQLFYIFEYAVLFAFVFGNRQPIVFINLSNCPPSLLLIQLNLFLIYFIPFLFLLLVWQNKIKLP